MLQEWETPAAATDVPHGLQSDGSCVGMAWAEWALATDLPPTALLMSCGWVWGRLHVVILALCTTLNHRPGTTVDFIYLHVSTECKDLLKTRLLKRKLLSMAGHLSAWTLIFTGVSLLLW